jgi:hypothetical protein
MDPFGEGPRFGPRSQGSSLPPGARRLSTALRDEQNRTCSPSVRTVTRSRGPLPARSAVTPRPVARAQRVPAASRIGVRIDRAEDAVGLHGVGDTAENSGGDDRPGT